VNKGNVLLHILKNFKTMMTSE